MNVLSLDPMYSPLHQMIMDRIADGNRYAILSSLGLSVYFNKTKIIYFNKEVVKYKDNAVYIPSDILNLVLSDENHYSMFLKKIKKRDLNQDEIVYFSYFYIFLENFIITNQIDLILLHNDLRWHHSLAIHLCKKHNLKYLVTEQGLFRPHTTVVDNVGVNALSNVKERFLYHVGQAECKSEVNYAITSSHDSYTSYYNFLRYLFLSKLGVVFGTESEYVHKRHGVLDYLKRFYKIKIYPKITMLNNKKESPSTREKDVKRLIFVPLQLELDTQILVHSDFINNQEIIDAITTSFINAKLESKYQLVFKLHPNDTNQYNFMAGVNVTDERITDTFLEKVSLVIAINSSAILSILSTTIPIITLGRSIYNIEGVSEYSTISNLSDKINDVIKNGCSLHNREKYLKYLKDKYSFNGAGYCYPDSEIERIVDELIMSEE
ncbi:hypothetical protein [Plesiomonas shigelloides]|uniref:Phosphoribosylamine--glycine ligase n=1 Tax=Plesiomonas shigelloides TaxID=703 RepID=A0A4D6U7G4_PLESH|nr:hypothetical protein [Plesiomonas shigelloides]KAB7697389.1 hypothetical protein GBN15_07710 [Plesiomonas shigelloides]QCH03172.1 phosphoribosylamine--glycine ligase [Plesiomonas shigelloides]